MGPEILTLIAAAVGIEYAYQKGHLAIAAKWLKQNLIPESFFQTKDKAESKKQWFDEDF